MSAYMTADEVADEIGMTADWVRRQCAAGVIKGKKLGQEWRIHRDNLAAFMEAPEPAPASRQRPERLSARQRRRSA